MLHVCNAAQPPMVVRKMEAQLEYTVCIHTAYTVLHILYAQLVLTNKISASKLS